MISKLFIKLKLFVIPNLFLVASIFFALPGFAQSEGGASGAGNGGDAVVCKNIKRAYVLDYWEAQNEVNPPLKINLGGPALTEYEKVELIISRVRRLDPVFATELSDRFTKFKDLVLVQDRVAIKEINDEKSVINPKNGCIKLQLAVNKKKVDPFFNKKFLIDQDIWKIMSRDEKAGLIFHEVLYWSEIDRGAIDSLGTRRLNAILASEAGSRLTSAEYLSLLQLYSLRTVASINELPISIKKGEEPTFSIQGKIAQAKILQDTFTEISSSGGNGLSTILTAKCLKDSIVQFDDKGKIVDCITNQYKIQIQLGDKTQISEFSCTPQSITKLSPATAILIRLSLTTPDFSKKIDLSGVNVEFYTSGVVKSISNTLTSFVADLNAPTFNLTAGATITGAQFTEGMSLETLNVSVNGLTFLNDLVTGTKHELSWKQNHLYEVHLNPETKQVMQIK